MRDELCLCAFIASILYVDIYRDEDCSSRLGHVCACGCVVGGSYWSSCIGCVGML